jgi:hypothetical protein
MSIKLDKLPERATKLIVADFSSETEDGMQRIETLWDYYDVLKDKYVIDYWGELFEESKEEVIKWIDDVLRLEPHQYTCYEDTDIRELREHLVKQLFTL